MKNVIAFKKGDIVYEKEYYGDPFKIIKIKNGAFEASSILDLEFRTFKLNDIIMAPEYIPRTKKK